MNKFLLSILTLFLLTGLSAQDEAIFMHYTVNPILVNPAAAGFSEAYQLQFNARAQWTGFKDSPKTIGVRYNGPIGPSFGLGVGVLSESAAQMTRTKLQLDYAFRFAFGRERVGVKDWKVAVGFFTEFQRMQIDNEITGGTFYNPGDGLLEEYLNGKGQFDAAVGGFFTYQENTYAGLTFNNLVSSRLSDIAGSTNQESFLSYYTFLLGHRIYSEDLKISFEPSILLRQVRNTPFQMDLNLRAGFMQDQLIAGLSYRSLGAMGILLGTKLPNFNLYYSYDVSFQRFQQYNTGSHEVTVALSLERNRNRKNESNKR